MRNKPYFKIILFIHSLKSLIQPRMRKYCRVLQIFSAKWFSRYDEHFILIFTDRFTPWFLNLSTGILIEYLTFKKLYKGGFQFSLPTLPEGYSSCAKKHKTSYSDRQPQLQYTLGSFVVFITRFCVWLFSVARSRCSVFEHAYKLFFIVIFELNLRKLVWIRSIICLR